MRYEVGDVVVDPTDDPLLSVRQGAEDEGLIHRLRALVNRHTAACGSRGQAQVRQGLDRGQAQVGQR